MTDELRIEDISSGEQLTVEPHLVVAGYTGADAAAVQNHIDELSAIGVPEPESVPAFYSMPEGLLTQESEIRVEGVETSGEVEPVLIRTESGIYLTVGSDHTDRRLERVDIARSKESCPKPIARRAIRVPEEGFDWASIAIRSTVDGEEYQTGTLAALRSPLEVLQLWDVHISSRGDTVLFGGTVPLHTGGFNYGREWVVELEIPGVGAIAHHYTTISAH